MRSTLRMIFTRLLAPDGSKPTIGGIQTYLQSLASVAASVEMRPVLYQCANQAFTQQLGELEIRGVPTGGLDVSLPGRQRVYDAAMADTAGQDIILFGTDTFSVPTTYSRAVLIQHGISWDKPIEPGRFGRLDRVGWFKSLKMARRHAVFRSCFENAPNRVCVDYNFQNWYRTFLPDMAGKRTWVIPNFTPIPDVALIGTKLRNGDSRPVSILFARRFETYRGTRLMGEVASRLLREFDHVRFTFAGDGPDKTWLTARFADEARVRFCTASYEQRMTLPLEHEIAVVPTLGSEGTSLSLAEAMACGCAVVATDVGGMTNMILDGYNGLLVSPCAESLYAGLRSIIMDGPRRALLGRRAREVAEEAFSEDKWRDRWRGVFEELGRTEVQK